MVADSDDSTVDTEKRGTHNRTKSIESESKFQKLIDFTSNEDCCSTRHDKMKGKGMQLRSRKLEKKHNDESNTNEE